MSRILRVISMLTLALLLSGVISAAAIAQDQGPGTLGTASVDIDPDIACNDASLGWSTNDGCESGEVKADFSITWASAEGTLDLIRVNVHEGDNPTGTVITTYDIDVVNITPGGSNPDPYTYNHPPIYVDVGNYKTGTYCVWMRAIATDGSSIGGAYEDFVIKQKLSVYKFSDLDGDGIQDAGEPDIPDWNVTIRQGSVIGSGTIIYNGPVSGTQSPPLCVTMPVNIVEESQAGWVVTTADGVDVVVAITDTSVSQVVFGNRQFGNLTICKYNDIDGDGWTATDPGLSNWQFQVTGPGGYSNTVTTGTGGCITINGLVPGSYTVTEVHQAPWMNTDPGGAPPYQKTGIVTGGTTATVRFGNRMPGNLTICKYNDIDGDGWTVTDPGLSNWQFQVTGPGGYSNTVTTGTGGCITITGLVPGSYTVTEVPQAGWINTDPGGAEPYQKIGAVTGGTTATVRFGNMLPKGNLHICKYEDTDGNQQQDSGEPLLKGWTFTVNGPEYPTGLTVKDGDPSDDDGTANGCVLLQGIKIGQYTIAEQLKAGYIATDTPAMPVEVVNGQTTEVKFGNQPHRTTPTLSQWGIMALSLIMGGMVIWTVRRRLVNKAG